MSDTDVTIFNLRDRSVTKTASTSQRKSHRSSTKSKSSTGSESSAGEQITDHLVTDDSVFAEPHDAPNTEQAELELVTTFQQLGCHDSPPPAAPPAYAQSTPIEAPPEDRLLKRNRYLILRIERTCFKVPFAPSLYPITELSEMAECREVTFSKELPKSSADDEACKKHVFATPETKHTFEMRGYDSDDHEPTARIAISEIPAPRPIVSDSVIAPKPFSGTATEDPEAWVEYFDRYAYANYKNMNDDEQTALFAMFMRDGAAQWLSTLPPQTTVHILHLSRPFETITLNHANFCGKRRAIFSIRANGQTNAWTILSHD
jgi:hypothetical protein